MKTWKNMTTFEKIQFFSAIIPFYSFLFVAITTYIICWKHKKIFLRMQLTAVAYFIPLVLASMYMDWESQPVITVLLLFLSIMVSFVGNYFLLLIQFRLNKTNKESHDL